MSTSTGSEFYPLCEAIERATGHRPHIATARRWFKKGVAGIKLKVHFVAGKFVTSPSEVLQFVAASTERKTARYNAAPIEIPDEPKPLKTDAVEAAVRKFEAMKPKPKAKRSAKKV
jgi:hypothetical protein